MAGGARPLPETALPRRPERANGRRRYEMLVSAAQRLLERDGIAALTIQQIAREARVPMASVYHFFPSPAAACVAVAEAYLQGFSEIVARPIARVTEMTWREVIATLMRRAFDHYRAHPYAQHLILGSEYSWQIRQADVRNNRALARAVGALIRAKVPAVDDQVLVEALVVGIHIQDAIWSLSVVEHGAVTRQAMDEAVLAACGYLEAKLSAT